MNSKQTPAGTRARSAASTASDIESKSASSPDTAAEARRRRTAIAAFYRAEARGFAPGRELEDWLEAEREVDASDAGLPEQAATAQPGKAGGASARSDPAATRGRAAPRRAKTARETTREAVHGPDVQARNGKES
jgi:hypothetical protein